MKPERIEEILRKALSPKAPEDLMQKLTGDIRLPRPAAARETVSWSSRPSWARRWLPALSFAGLFIACVVAIAMQANVLNGLQQENSKLRVAVENPVVANTGAAAQLPATADELERLRKDNAELLKLQGEVKQLQAELQGMAQLQAENQQLRTRAAAMKATADPDQEALAKAKARAERIMCVNNLKQVGLAGRIWAGDNKDIYPGNFLCMSNEMSTWKILKCPGDKSREVTSWADVEAGNISYIMDAPGVVEGSPDYSPNIVFVECPIHHNVCLIDGSVQQLSDERYQALKVINGRKVLAP